MDSIEERWVMSLTEANSSVSDEVEIVDSDAIVNQILHSPGYSASLRLSVEDLDLFRALINEQWLARIAQVHPQLQDEARSLGLMNYHQLSNRLEHEKLWPKEHRILDQSAVEALKRTAFFNQLHTIFGSFTIAEGFYGSTHVAGLEEIYWRLVRPEMASDVGPLHADCWFHEMINMKGKAFAPDAFTLKIWIPILSEPGRNGLLMVADSHTREWKHSTRWIDGQPKPQFDDVAEAFLVPTEPGNMLIFHERTLHGGALNRGQHTRVSAEITLVFDPRSPIARAAAQANLAHA
jgi:hypothetical protein